MLKFMLSLQRIGGNKWIMRQQPTSKAWKKKEVAH